MLCDDSTAAGCFFLPEVVFGLLAMEGALKVLFTGITALVARHYTRKMSLVL